MSQSIFKKNDQICPVSQKIQLTENKVDCFRRLGEPIRIYTKRFCCQKSVGIKTEQQDKTFLVN